jgi:hypothetical protein
MDSIKDQKEQKLQKLKLLARLHELRSFKDLLQIEITKCASYANYWAHYATSTCNAERNIKRGCEKSETYPDGYKPLTITEKEREAFQTSCNHIHRISECYDTMLKYCQEEREILEKLDKIEMMEKC